MKAIKFSLNQNYAQILIISDSKSILQAIERNNWNKQSGKLVIDIAQEIIECSRRNKLISFLWIKAHAGILYNETVDQLAKEAAISGSFLDIPLPYTDFLCQEKIKIRSQWDGEWKTSSNIKGKYYSWIQPHIPRFPWFHNMAVHRRVTSTITRMRFNHGCFPAHLFRINLRNSDTCDCNNSDVGDINHIIFVCPKYHHHREQFISDLKKIKVPFPTSILSLLVMNDKSVLRCLSKFILVSNLRLWWNA